MEIEKKSMKFIRYKKYGKKTTKNIILSWGSTKGAIIDSMDKLDCKFIQVLYMKPFPKEIIRELGGKNVILVENNSTGQLGELLRKETGFEIPPENKILKYDGRPFLADKLREEIGKKLK
jgi:2-oxoglutarate ferredoxin oxidoreductase subunit alpha